MIQHSPFRATLKAKVAAGVIFVFLCLSGIPAFPQQLQPVQIQQGPTQEQLGIQYYNSREYDKAAAIFEPLFDKNPSYLNYYYYLISLVELKDYDKCEKIVRKMIKASPNDIKFQVDLGYVYNVRGDVAKGKKIYDECLKDLKASNSKADMIQISNLANAFATRREMDYMIKTYMRGRELLKDKNAFSLDLALLYEQMGETEKMITEYLAVLSSNPQQTEMVKNRLQSYLATDTEGSVNELFRNTLLKYTQQNPDESIYADLLLWYSIQQKDFELALIQAKALDRRYNESGQRIFELAQLSLSNGDYKIAAEALNYIVKKNVNPDLVLAARINLLDVDYYNLSQNPNSTSADYLLLEKKNKDLLDELGTTASTLPLVRKLAHLEAFNLNKLDDAMTLLENAIALPNIRPQALAECKLELADIYLFSGEQWEATLLYSQVEKSFKNEPIGHEAKFRNAKLSYYIGEFDWAKTQLDILKAATSKLIANDALALSIMLHENMDEDSSYTELKKYAHADLLLYQNKDQEALLVLDSILTESPGHNIVDEVLFMKAEIAVKNRNFTQAATFYQKIFESYPYDLLADDALFYLALLYENQLNDKTKAMELFQKLMTTYPGSLYVVDARKHFRQLREGNGKMPL